MNRDGPEHGTLIGKYVEIYLRCAEDESNRLRRGWAQDPALERLREDYDNIQYALRLAHEHGETEKLLRLCGALDRYWLIRGVTSQEANWLEASLANGQAAPPLTIAAASSSLACLRRRQNRYPEASRYYKESLKVYMRAGERKEAAWILLYLGMVTTDEGDRILSGRYYKKSLDRFVEAGDERGIAFALNELAYTATKQGDHVLARDHRERSLAIFRSTGEQEGLAWALYNMGQTLSDLGDTQPAIVAHQGGTVVVQDPEIRERNRLVAIQPEHPRIKYG